MQGQVTLQGQAAKRRRHNSLAPVAEMKKGAYTLWQSGEGAPDLILIGTGSEVAVALEAGRMLAAAPKAGGKNVGEGSVLGGLGRILDGDNGF